MEFQQPDAQEDTHRSHVNIVSATVSSSSAPTDEGLTPTRVRPPAALRSRRNPVVNACTVVPSSVLSSSSSSPSSTTTNASVSNTNAQGEVISSTNNNNVNNNMQFVQPPLVSQDTSPSSPATPIQNNSNSNNAVCPSLSAPPPSSLTLPSSPMCVKGKVPAKEPMEAQTCSKAIDISDFECSLCFRVFFQPVTTVCGHVFCKQCLFSALKYSVQCPLCRHKLETSPLQHKYAVNVVLMNMIEKYFPKEYKDRLEEDQYLQESAAPSTEKQQQEEESANLSSSPSWSCIIPSLRSTCHVILSCGGF